METTTAAITWNATTARSGNRKQTRSWRERYHAALMICRKYHAFKFTDARKNGRSINVLWSNDEHRCHRALAKLANQWRESTNGIRYTFTTN